MKKKSPKIFNSVPEIISFFTVVFIIGLLLADCFTSDLYIAWLGLALGSLTISFFSKSSKTRVISIFCAALFASMFYGAVRFIPDTNFSDLMNLDNTTGVLTGRYTGKSNISKTNITYTFDNLTYTTNDQKITIPIEINCRYTANRVKIYPYQNYTMTGKLKIIDFDKHPIFNVASFTNTDPGINSVLAISKSIQNKITHGLTSVLKKEHAAIIIGFILGDTSQITDKSIFTETGISHLLAISGQHIMILIMVIASILHWFKIPPISRTLLISILLAFYATITIGSPSVWRALIMYISIATIMHLESFPSPIRPISIAAFIMLLYDPSLLNNSAFILSFTAVLSIIFLRKPIEYFISKLKFPTVLTRYLAVTFAANLGTMPMVAYLFGTVSLSALFVNPLILWTFTFVLPVAFFITFLSIISIPLAIFLSPGLSILLDLLISCLEYVKNIPGLYYQVGNVSPTVTLLIYSALLASVTAFNKWQVKNFGKLSQPKLADISTRQLPKKEEIKICIDSQSMAMPTLLGKSPKLNQLSEKSANTNPFKVPEIIEAIDEMLCGLKTIPNNTPINSDAVIPLTILLIDSKKLYYKLSAIDENLMKQEPERLLQAHIFMLAIVGYELLNRISTIINPPISEEEINIETTVTDRYLSVAILSDSIMNSYLSERVTDPSLGAILGEGHKLYKKAENHLEKILSDKCFEECILEHMSLRKEVMIWCHKFISRDNFLRSKEQQQ